MKKIATLVAVVFAFATTASAQVTGTWRTETGETGGYAVVQISPCGANVCGVITSIVNNDNQSAVGEAIIVGMEDRGNGKYGGGRIWAPDQDKWYDAKMELNGNTLKVSGCVAGGLICRAKNWTRL